MPAQQPDHYSVLGVTPDSTFAEIRKAFLGKSLSYHPDKRAKVEAEQAHKDFVLISAAYDILRHPESRSKYDNTRRAQGTQSAGASQKTNSNGGNSRNRGNAGEQASEPRASQFPKSPRSYTDQAEQDARRSQQARNDSREEHKKWQAESESSDSGYGSGSEQTHQNEPSQAYEVPRHEDHKEFSPEEEAWLRYRTAKNNLHGLSFSLRDSLYRVLEVIRSLREVKVVKRQAREARAQLHFIEISFAGIERNVETVCSPTSLPEATVTRIKKLMILEDNIRKFLRVLEARPPGLTPPEQEAVETSGLLLEAMGKWSQLCR